MSRYLDLDNLGSDLSDKQIADWIEFFLQQHAKDEEELGEEIPLEPEDIEKLRDCSINGGPLTRTVAIRHLLWHGPCSWEDIETWIFDSDRDVRYWVIDISIGEEFTFGGRLYLTDKARFVHLVSAVAERYPGTMDSMFALRSYAIEDSELLELSWQEANRLLDINNADLNTALIVSYFEDVIPGLNWGPDDPHIKSWIRGNDGWRQEILLRVAAWVGLDEGRLREIVQALTKSKDRWVAEIAEKLLEGRLGCRDL